MSQFFFLLVLLLGACSPYVQSTDIAASSTTTPPATILPTGTMQPKTTATPGTAQVTAYESLNIRSEPGTGADVLGYLYHDNQVILTGKCSEDPKGWAQILYKGRSAWVNAHYLSDNKCAK